MPGRGAACSEGFETPGELGGPNLASDIVALHIERIAALVEVGRGNGGNPIEQIIIGNNDFAKQVNSRLPEFEGGVFVGRRGFAAAWFHAAIMQRTEAGYFVE